MDCLLHQVLVAMLTVAPVEAAPAAGKTVEISPRPLVSAPSKAERPAVRLSKKSRSGAQVAQVILPRAAVN